MENMNSVTLPSAWASALINGDFSGLSPEEIDDLNTCAPKVNYHTIEEESFICRFNGIVTECCTYIHS